MNLAIAGTTLRPSPAMDRKIWSKIPIELLERILSLLPLKTFLSLRSTCKYFRSLIFSPLFLSKHNQPVSSFLLLSHPRSPDYLLYDTLLNTWRTSGLRLSRSLTLTPLLSTATSLLCFSSLPDSSNSVFIIHNLLSRCSRSIRFPEHPFAFELPTLVVSSNGNYKLFCLSSGLSSSKSYAYVYDSRERSWARYDGIRRSLGYSFHQQGVFFNGCLYFATREPFLVVNFDLQEGNWEVLEAGLPDELTFIRLATATSHTATSYYRDEEYSSITSSSSSSSNSNSNSNSNNGNGNGKGDRLFMFGGIGRNGISKSMKIWEYDENEGRWDEVDSVPELMCRKFVSVCYHNYEHIYCFWHEGMICVCCYNWPEVLYYKVSRRTWHWLPKCPSLPEKWSCGFKWFSFVPRLCAIV